MAAACGRHPLRPRVAAGVAGPAAADGPEMTASMLLADDLFFKQHDYLFSMPAIQRPYDWGEEQARQLLEDLLASMGEEGMDPL